MMSTPCIFPTVRVPLLVSKHVVCEILSAMDLPHSSYQNFGSKFLWGMWSGVHPSPENENLVRTWHLGCELVCLKYPPPPPHMKAWPGLWINLSWCGVPPPMKIWLGLGNCDLSWKLGQEFWVDFSWSGIPSQMKIWLGLGKWWFTLVWSTPTPENENLAMTLIWFELVWSTPLPPCPPPTPQMKTWPGLGTWDLSCSGVLPPKWKLGQDLAIGFELFWSTAFLLIGSWWVGTNRCIPQRYRLVEVCSERWISDLVACCTGTSR